MFFISLPPPCVLLRAASQSLIGRVARYTSSSDFDLQPAIAHNLEAINFEHLLMSLRAAGAPVLKTAAKLYNSA